MQMRAAVQPRKVVLAEHDHDMRDLIALNLRRAGIIVEEAPDGRALLDTLADIEANSDRELPDLIVSDVHMPGATGMDALARVREMCPDVPVIIITAFGDADTHDEAERLGAAAVFDKPFDLFAFRDAVVTLLGY